jgi:ferredoxin
MTTEYRVRLDREACEGVFACLVRDDRFVEAPDGLATIEGGIESEHEETGTELLAFADDRLGSAEEAARACPVDAIDVIAEADHE